MTDQARAAYAEKVLTEEQRRWVVRAHGRGPSTRTATEMEALAIIDSLITYGVEQEAVLARAETQWRRAIDTERRREHEHHVAHEAAEARLTAVREVRDWVAFAEASGVLNHLVIDEQTQHAMGTVRGELDRILDDAPHDGVHVRERNATQRRRGRFLTHSTARREMTPPRET